MSAVRAQLQDASRIVVKLGSLVVTTADGEVDVANLTNLAEQICELTRAGKEVVLITSGAIRAGRNQLGIHDRSLDLPARQAAAAIGQIERPCPCRVSAMSARDEWPPRRTVW